MKAVAIVPVFNEEKTIKQVLYDLSRIKFLDKIIVVDDASTDNSWKIIKSSKGKVISLRNSKNLGKGYSIYNGLQKLPKNYDGLVLFLDADILGYSEKNLSKLVNPIITNESDWTYGTTQYKTFRNPNFLTRYIGQRCYKYSEIKTLILEFKNTGKYGLEVLLNRKLGHLDSKLIYLKGTKHLLKNKKRNAINAVNEYLIEIMSIICLEIKVRI